MWTGLVYNIAGDQYMKKLNEDFLDVFEQAKLAQIVELSMHKNATVDLLLTSSSTFVVNCEPSPGFSDHGTSVLVNIICPQKIKLQRKINCWNWADIDSLWTKVRNCMNNIIRTETIETPIKNL